MRLATFNMLHGRSIDDGQVRERDLAEAATDIDADVVGLQEVDRAQDRSGGLDQTAVVADALGAAHWRFVPTLEGIPGGAWTASRVEDGSTVPGPAFGIGLVSRWPVQSWHVRRFGPAPIGLPLLVPGSKGLTRVDDEPRAAVGAVLDTPAGRLTVVTAHLSFVPGWNVAQLRALAGWARTLPGPRVLLGDFNLPGVVPRLTTGWAQAARVPTYPAWRPRVQLDHLLLDGMSPSAVTGARSVRTAISDHCALVVDLHLS